MTSQAERIAALRYELGGMLPPDLPRPVPAVTDPAYQDWRRKFQAHTDRKESILREIRSLGGDHAAL